MVDGDDKASKVSEGESKAIILRTEESAMVQHEPRFEIRDPDFVLMLMVIESNTDDETALLIHLSRLYAFLCGHRQGDAEQYIQDEQDAYEAASRDHRGFLRC